MPIHRPIHRIAKAAVFAAAIAVLPLSAAQAQYYGPPCSPFPLTWPFCIAGAAVNTAAAIATAPFAGPYYYGSPYYYYPAYYAPAYYYRRRHHRRHRYQTRY